eukprot:Blabericola_migrator_1__5003@NODE_259_length_10733_cov_186_924620_g217_i0_p2_GENE_NODE_259_length_10733_cov_186_924620_g217_i0NODE_259_length_10733_cov_186_924620_g217_i0_p2_ORF_typecomplete_len664_score67_70Sushi/PF00084_20/25Sushi/PF00084_20/6_8e02Sushi/PF00084_20/4_8e02Sushi/PF00084_20/10_NODE_259_length_10733_cov_186_924620_g217_i063768367
MARPLCVSSSHTCVMILRAFIFIFALSAHGYGDERPLLSGFLNAFPANDVFAELIALKQQRQVANRNRKNELRASEPMDLVQYKALPAPVEYEFKSVADAGCPLGFIESDGQCLEAGVIKARVSCPSGCQPLGSESLTCNCIEEAPLETQCDAGYFLVKSKVQQVCTRRTMIAPSFVCDHANARIEDGYCLHTDVFPAKATCPTDRYHLKGELCVVEDTISPTYDCPNGFSRGSAEQLRASLSTPRWLAPQKRKNGARDVIFPALEDGATDDICISEKTAKPIPRCPDGTRLGDTATIGSVCLRDLYELPITECPTGYQPDEGAVGRCRKGLQFPADKMCPSHYNPVPPLIRGLVSQADREARTDTHLADSSEEDVLTRREMVSIDPTFTEAETKHEGEHIDRISTTKPIEPPLVEKESESVPSQWPPLTKPTVSVVSLKDGFDCELKTYETPKPVCRDGFDFSVRDNACIKVLKEAPSIMCESPGFVFDGKQCVLTERTSVEYSCPHGSLLRGDVCVSNEVTAGIPSCLPKSNLRFEPSMGYCVGYEEVPVFLDCPSGMLLDPSASVCLDSTSLKPQLTCPDRYALHPAREVCVKQSVEQPMWQCVSAEDDILNGGQPLLVGDQCHLLIRSPPKAVCPAHFKVTDNNMCEGDESKPLELVGR